MADGKSEDKENSEIKSHSISGKSSIIINSISEVILAKAAANIISGDYLAYFSNIFSNRKNKSVAKEKTELMKELTALDVDPEIFDSLLTNELDRKLKVSFGVAFLILTCLFTVASYAIVIFNSAYQWGVPEIAITALIIETPIQFIGLLYIIARNLFPQASESK